MYFIVSHRICVANNNEYALLFSLVVFHFFLTRLFDKQTLHWQCCLFSLACKLS